MSPYRRPVTEEERRRVLEQSGLTRRSERERLDVLCRGAAELLVAPFAAVNLHDGHQQYAAGKYPPDDDRYTPIAKSGCADVVAAEEPVLVTNMLQHPRLRLLPIVLEQRYRSYLGVPVFHDGVCIGAFCVMDLKVRDWNGWNVSSLQAVARLAGLSMERDGP